MNKTVNPEIEPFIKAYNSSEKNINGSFNIKYMDDVIYLTVTPARGNGRFVDFNVLLKEIRKHSFNPDNKLKFIEEIVDIVKMRNVQIENCPIEMEKIDLVEQISQNNEITVDITLDKMQAFLNIDIKEPKKITVNDFIIILRDSGVVYGVDLSILNKLSEHLTQKPYQNKILIAKGRRFIEGRDAIIKLRPGFERMTEENELRSPILPANTIILIKEPHIEPIPVKFVDGQEKMPSTINNTIQDPVIEAGKGVLENKREDGTIEYKTNTRGVVVFKEKRLLYVIPAIGAVFTLFLSSDNTKLIFDAISSKGKLADLKFDQIKSAIQKKNIREKFVNYPLIVEQIEKVNRGEMHSIIGLVIAQGIKPIHGENGKIEYHESVNNYRKIHYREDGSVDHRLSSLIQSVEPGEIIARIIPPDSNKKDGLDVFGNVIKAKSGRYPDIQCGYGTKFSKDKLSVISTINGRIRVSGNMISVEPLLHIPGDVNYRTGSIHFKGNVAVTGDVLDGFNIICSGDVVIKNNVGACRIVCEGDLTIEGGINGKDKAEIFVAGNLNVGFIEQARVEVRGNIYIKKSATLSTIYSAKRIIFPKLSPNSGVIGCNLIALEIIDLGRIGSERGGTETSIILGFDYDLIRTNKRIQKKLMNVQTKITKLNTGRIELEKNNLVDDLKKSDDELKKSLKEFDDLLMFQREILKQMESKTQNYLICRKIMYPEVTIILENLKKQLKETHPACVFKKDNENKKIIHARYNPKEEYYKEN